MQSGAGIRLRLTIMARLLRKLRAASTSLWHLDEMICLFGRDRIHDVEHAQGGCCRAVAVVDVAHGNTRRT